MQGDTSPDHTHDHKCMIRHGYAPANEEGGRGNTHTHLVHTAQHKQASRTYRVPSENQVPIWWPDLRQRSPRGTLFPTALYISPSRGVRDGCQAEELCPMGGSPLVLRLLSGVPCARCADARPRDWQMCDTLRTASAIDRRNL